MKTSVNYLKSLAQSEGIYDPAKDFSYPNYALGDTPATEIYGPTNTQRLAAIRKRIDPDGVMELAGGFSF